MEKYHLANRPNRELKEKSEIDAILKKGKYVTISMCRDNEPYILTLSYGYDLDKKALYFHSSKKGLKLDFLQSNSRVCATVIEDGGYVADECEHEYRTVVFWGKMEVIEDMDEKKYGMNVLLQHLEEKESVIKRLLLQSDKVYTNMSILKLDIQEIHGKAGR